MKALGFIETNGLIAAVESADAMLKAAQVSLVDKVYVGGGLVTITVTGDVGAVKASVEAGAAAIRQMDSNLLISQHVIPRPHQELDGLIGFPKKPHDIASKESVIGEKANTKEEASDTKEQALSVEQDLEHIDKEKIDRAVKEEGLEVVMGTLNKLKVVKLRNLARQYTDFGVAENLISKTDKKMLLAEFESYYSKNK